MAILDAAALVKDLRRVFATGKTRSAEWRMEQLRGITRLATERSAEVAEALKADIAKPAKEAAYETGAVVAAANNIAANLEKWTAPEKISSPVPFFANSAIIPEPLGVVLIISPWNYPFALCMEPIAGAIAAGNVVVLKPSELAPATSALLAKLIPLYLDSSAVRVVEGAIPETTALLEQKWDTIFYTGSTRVGKIILAAAAKHLTPCTLELGGKSPTIVDETADLDVVAKRISWGKWSTNNGQACICPDYILTDKSTGGALIQKLKETVKQFYGEDLGNAAENRARIINADHFRRLSGLLDHESTAEKIVFGGERNEKTLYIAPTLILDPPLDSPVMEEEIFGPLLPIITVEDIGEAIGIVNSRPKPLALYLFSNDQHAVDRVVNETSSGGLTVNDVLLHAVNPAMPFGGVGDSGMGAYHDKYSLDAFSHKKPVLYQSLAVEMPGRYP